MIYSTLIPVRGINILIGAMDGFAHELNQMV